MGHSLRVNGSSKVVYMDHMTKDLHEVILPIVRRNLPGIWGAELDSRVVRHEPLDQDIYQTEDGVMGDLCFEVWDQHNNNFAVHALWPLCQRPLHDEIVTIEYCS